MKTTLLLILILFTCFVYGNGLFNEGGIPKNRQLVLGTNDILKVKNSQAEDVFSWQVGGVIHDLKVLDNGHILYANGDVAREVDTAKKIYWQYEPQNKQGGGVYGVQRLKNGNTMVAENSTGRILILDTQAKIIDSIMTLDFKAASHQNMRLARVLDNGNYLVCHSGKNIVREYTPKGDVVWQQKVPQLAFCAERLPNGNTLIASLNQIQEYARDGKVSWEFKANDIPNITIRNMTGFKVLPNGNLLIGCYMPHAKGSPAQSMFEITRDKKLVFRYGHADKEGSIMAVDYAK